MALLRKEEAGSHGAEVLCNMGPLLSLFTFKSNVWVSFIRQLLFC